LFDSVVLLVRSNEAINGQITFTDESLDARTLTRVGDVIYDDTQSIFGDVASMLFDGVGTEYVSIPKNTDMEFADRTVEFCVEAWIYVTDNTRVNTIINGRDSGSAEEWDFRVASWTGNSANLAFSVWGSGVSRLSVAATLAIDQNTWHHVAFTRENVAGDGLGKLYVDGVESSGGGVTQTIDGTTNTGVYQIGQNAFNSSRNFEGHIDSVRITRGDIRYTGNFTPPTAPFPIKN